MPDDNVCSCIFDTGGYNNDGDCGKPTIMIQHRNTDYETGYAIMQSIKTILDNVVTGTSIFGYEIVGDINFLGTELSKIEFDSVLWFAYPKGTSKIKTDINRDILRATGEEFGITTVTAISIDETWSALRFRPIMQVGK